MTRSRSILGYVLLMLCFAVGANAQNQAVIDPGATIVVRTNEDINAKDSDGRVFSGVVEKDVIGRNGSIAIHRGSDVDLVVKRISDSELALDLKSIMINGQRYSVATDESYVTAEKKEGVGINKRTGKYVGGGALIGAVIGAVAGGGKGAAIGAGAGAAAGAGAQILTRGRSVRVPAESLLTFQLQQPIRAGLSNTTVSQDRSTYSDAYLDGLRTGRSDAERNLRRDMRTSRWTTSRDRRDYEAGYDRGYRDELADIDDDIDRDVDRDVDRATLSIGRDNIIRWQAPSNVRVYVQVDNHRLQLFAEGPSGAQAAPWIEPGHTYLFVIQDMRGSELARERLDTRNWRR